MSFLSQFASAHPLVFTLLLWPLITALVTGAFGWEGHLSADDYAKLPKPFAYALHFMAASGIDAPEVLAFLAKLFGKGGGGTTMLVAVLLSLQLVACPFLQAHGAQDGALTVADAVCVEQKFGEPVAQIVKECGLAQDLFQIVADLISSLAAKQKTQLAEMQRKIDAYNGAGYRGPDGGAAPGASSK